MYECKIAEKLVELRTLRGETQEDVARSLSVSNKTVSKWENGASMPDLSMLVEISRFYGVTTDELLGLSEDKRLSTAEEIQASFEGLDRRESVLKSFEAVKALIPAMYKTVSRYREENVASEDAFPMNFSHGQRSMIATRDFFEFTTNSENVNMAVMMLRNKANFAWMNDPSKQKKIVRYFKYLSNEDALSVIYFIHSTSCSKSFTADYVAKHTGVNEERVTEILNEFCAVGACHWVTAQLSEGEVRVYECYGDGVMLSIISLAFEIMCGNQSYEYCFNGRCKMIGGKEDELIG